MSIENLSNEKYNVHLLYTDSNLIELFVYDSLKASCEADLESTINVNNQGSFTSMLELINVQPFLADKWFVVLDYKRVSKNAAKYKGIFTSDTAKFLIKVSNYKEFLEAKELIKSTNALINELYLAFLRLRDTSRLLDGFGLSSNLIEFVYKSYSRDPEKIFILRKALLEGLKADTRKDVVALCGSSSGSILSFVISLLSSNVKTDKGEAISLKRKVTDILELCGVYEVSTLRRYLGSTLKDIIDIKEMYLNGVIYDNIRGLPDNFDEKRYSKYNYALKRILALSFVDVVGLYLTLQGSGHWKKDIDAVAFIYKVYSEKEKVG